MREILFRGKRKDNGEWTQGYLFEAQDKSYICYGTTNDIPDMIEIEPSTICQYTGTRDKRCEKIFEGDIVKDMYDNPRIFGVVKRGEYQNPFENDEFGGHVGFYVEWKDKADLLRKDLVYWAKEAEFIGTIFDNPELIGDQP